MKHQHIYAADMLHNNQSENNMFILLYRTLP